MSGPIRIGILDSGVAPAFHHLIAGGARFNQDGQALEQRDQIGDHVGHGTFVTRLIAEMAPDATLLHAQVFGARFTSAPALVAAGLDWLNDQAVEIISMSFGMPHERAVMRDACERAIAEGRLLVAAAPAQGRPVYPAGWPGVIAVTGDARCKVKGETSDLLGQQADFGTWCASPEQGGGAIAGSSVATAHFTGLIATYLAHHKNASYDDVVAAFRASATYVGPEQRLAGGSLS